LISESVTVADLPASSCALLDDRGGIGRAGSFPPTGPSGLPENHPCSRCQRQLGIDETMWMVRSGPRTTSRAATAAASGFAGVIGGGTNVIDTAARLDRFSERHIKKDTPLPSAPKGCYQIKR
jgi:hypothetical protein